MKKSPSDEKSPARITVRRARDTLRPVYLSYTSPPHPDQDIIGWINVTRPLDDIFTVPVTL